MIVDQSLRFGRKLLVLGVLALPSFAGGCGEGDKNALPPAPSAPQDNERAAREAFMKSGGMSKAGAKPADKPADKSADKPADKPADK